MRDLWRVVAVALVGAMAGAMVGCAASPTGIEEPVFIERGPAPSYEEVAAAVNDRAGKLARMAARATMRVRHRNDNGKMETDQFDLTIRLDQPDHLYMKFDVAGVDLAVFGCDETEYWWVNIRDDRFAWLGTHERATPELVANFALPIHPLDFVQLMGMASIPAMQGDATVAWSENGHFLVVETASRFGRRRMMLSPQGDGYDTARVELLDMDGALTVSANLSDYEEFSPSRGAPKQRVAGEINFKLASGEADARLRPHYRFPSKNHARAFDRERLFKHYRLGPNEIELLDLMAAGGRDED